VAKENFFAPAWFQWQVLRNFLKSLVAVVSGNCLYFFLLMPALPVSARHNPFKLNLGLVLDAWICLVIYGVIEMALRRRRAAGRS
jgi:hypothetical protein